MMTRRGIIFGVIFLTAGCAKVAHMDQLLTLKSYSDNKEAQEKFVAAQDRNFEKLLEHLTGQEGLRLETRRQVTRKFGPPVFVRTVFQKGRHNELWLYRRAVGYFDVEKVYLTFDGEGRLVRWDHVRPPQTAPICRVRIPNSSKK